MKTAKIGQTDQMLIAWRTKTLNVILIILAIVALPALAVTTVSAVRSPEGMRYALIMAVAFMIVIALAVLRGINYYAKAWGLLLVGYLVATVSMVSSGLTSTGPWYALMLPVLALILIGVRPGILAAALSVFELTVLAFLFDRGVLIAIPRAYSPQGYAIIFTMILASGMALLVLFHRFQTRILEDQRRTAGELDEARALLEEQNRTLEERIAQRTAELTRSASELQESLRRLADIINFMPDAVLVIDQDGRIIAWNRALEELTGVKAEAMIGKGDYEYALPLYGKRRPILIDQVIMPHRNIQKGSTLIISRGEVLVGESYVPHLKGGGVYLVGTAAVLYDSRGQVAGAIEVMRDFTERKRMEENLAQAKEAAETATQAKSAFLATMSHEIRTPMNAIIGMTGLLLDTHLSLEQRDFAETIRTSGDSLLTIINDILDFSKIEAGRMELESQPFDLRECVESAVDLLAGKAREKGIDLACVVEGDVPAAILGDVTRLRQVLVNLLGNSVKFTEQGEVVVSVTSTKNLVTESENSSAVIQFTVRDTGIGIPPERQDRLFQSFSQVDASTTRRFGGTGLGLAISRRLVELMGGQMWVESQGIPGKGSAFHFTICASAAEAPASRPHMRSVQPHLEAKRVLIVDDNATNRQILTRQVKSWGMLPRDTASPLEALSWIRQGDPFEVALLDFQMPEMDGMALATEIHRLRPANQLPIVMLSSLGPREAHWEAGALAAYLLKPVKSSQLYNALVGIFGSETPVVEEQAESHFDAEMGKRHPLSILLAEDNAINQKLALLVLERLGYRADVAANGLEVLQSLRRQPYDLVLMDIQMPEMDGLEATRAIGREFHSEQRPRIAAMTANAMKEDRDECLAAGMDDFITKPIQLNELIAVLNHCPVHVEAGTHDGQIPPFMTPVVITQVDEAPGSMQSTPSPMSAPQDAGEMQSQASQPTLTPPVFDPSALQRLRATLGKQADVMLPVLVKGFLVEAPKLIAEAQRSLDENRSADLRRAAHTLKSNSATFGAMALAALARELEYAARDNLLAGAGELLQRIRVEFDQAQVTLQALPGIPKEQDHGK